MGAEVVTVSTDSKFVHLAWQQAEAELENVRFTMGSDTTGNVSRMFGVYDERTGMDLRGTFIISPDGTLLNSEVNFYNMGRNIDEVVRRLKANIYLARKNSEVCPSKWRDEGDATLSPSASMVGHVHEALAKK